jgi:hypothetical protein
VPLWVWVVLGWLALAAALAAIPWLHRRNRRR